MVLGWGEGKGRTHRRVLTVPVGSDQGTIIKVSKRYPASLRYGSEQTTPPMLRRGGVVSGTVPGGTSGGGPMETRIPQDKLIYDVATRSRDLNLHSPQPGLIPLPDASRFPFHNFYIVQPSTRIPTSIVTLLNQKQNPETQQKTEREPQTERSRVHERPPTYPPLGPPTRR